MKVVHPYKTPVLLITFNRPDYTQEVFNVIRKIKPISFYVAMDGPREGKPEDITAQSKIRDIISSVDWDCDVHTLYQKNNLGCGFGPATAISWALKDEDRVIVLEDDCVPNESFFAFCDEMLERYKNDTRVGMISGRSHQHGCVYFEKQDYIFSHYAHTLGWATWKRCWDDFDIWMKDYPQFLETGGALNVLPIKESAKKTNKRLLKMYKHIDKEVTHSWDSQGGYVFLKNNQLGIVPSRNLIQYIGFYGTHDHGTQTSSATMKAEELPDILRHPQFVLANIGYEKLHYRTYIKSIHPSIIKRGLLKIVRETKNLFRQKSM